MDGKKRKILGAVALSALTLFTGCKAKDIEAKKPQPIPETKTLNLCDTSEINAQNMYEKYVESFKSGDTSYINNEIEGLINEKYEMLMEKSEVEPTTDMWGTEIQNPITTYNFDGTLMEYDSEKYGNYYVGDESVKYIGNNYVKIKTKNGYFDIDKDVEKNIFTINNVDNKNSVSTEIIYNADKSSIINEKTKDGSLTLEFNSNGTIKSANRLDDKSITTIKQFEDGNVDVYKMYDKYEQLREEHLKDGSYYVIDHILDKNRYNYDVWVPQASTFTYYYDKNNNLKHIDYEARSKQNDGTRYEYEGKLLKNGDSYMHTQIFDSENKLVNDTKTELIYKTMKTEVRKQFEENGVEHTTVSKYDYTRLSPDPYIFDNMDGITGDTVFLSRDGIVEIEVIDGKTYKYATTDSNVYRKGDVVEVYAVDENNLTYYREDGTKLKSIDKEHITTHYDENEKINEIEDKEKNTYYYDYDKQIIKGYRNKTDDKITVKNGENEYDLQEYASSIMFREDGAVESWHQDENHYSVYFENGAEFKRDGITSYMYDSNGEIKSINVGGLETEYYSYENGLISSVKQNGVKKEYYESQNLKLIENYGDESNVSVFDADGNEYVLDKGDRAFFDESGNIKGIWGTKHIEFEGGRPIDMEQGEER